MVQTKYDWIALKQEFLVSDYEKVSEFIEKRIGKKTAKNSQVAKKTKGWSKEKQQIREKMLAKATQNAIAKQTKELEIPMEQLSIAKKNAVVKVIQMMMDKDNPLDVADMERVIKIIRTEMGLPNNYAKNENMNVDRIEGIHIVMGGNIIDSKEIGENNA